jgi:hypothetical protein
MRMKSWNVDNVNIMSSLPPAASKPARTYHHGDLRNALIDAGLAALEVHDASELSLRALARDLGVSANAVYRHFADKNALLAALAAAGGPGQRHLHRISLCAVCAAPPGLVPADVRTLHTHLCRTHAARVGHGRL